MGDIRFLPREHLQTLLDALRGQGFRTIGPTVQDGAIQYRDLEEVARLPFGWTDDQAPGSYRLSHTAAPRAFAWSTGPQALKPHLFAARETLWQASRDGAGALRFEPTPPDTARPLAVVGVRACDIAALRLLDRHFLDGVADPAYATRRSGLFVVAVHCAWPSDTCFCASTGDGPGAHDGYDLALSELDDGYLVEAGSAEGQAVAGRLPLVAADAAHLATARAEIDDAAKRQFRRLPGRDLNRTLFARLEHPRWDQVAERCLSCGNCSSVCPTCFCHAERDAPALGGETSAHLREWDSCFTQGHGRMHGLVIRPETRQRYRQWLTHKLGSWHEQYGRSGCVGCGRCITWCPVGIDITEEASAICAGDTAAGSAP